MHRGRLIHFAVFALILMTGCSKLPGLQVLAGQEPGTDPAADLTVQSLDLVMADKTGTADAGMTAAANRIESANPNVDIIEMRKDEESRVFTVDLLFNPPQSDTATLEGQLAQLDARRRALEVTWQGLMAESEGTDVLDVRLLAADALPTLDHGRSYIGYLRADARIDRSAAAKYLAGVRNLNNFYDLMLNGTLTYESATEFTPYEGTPNHPMFMLPAS